MSKGVNTLSYLTSLAIAANRCIKLSYAIFLEWILVNASPVSEPDLTDAFVSKWEHISAVMFLLWHLAERRVEAVLELKVMLHSY